MSRTAKPKPFATEAEMCARFIAALPPEWVSYAETSGWDILLVRRIDGFQIGIQAKLRMNPEVLDQTLERWGYYGLTYPAPDCRAVLVPEINPHLARIAGKLLVTTIVVSAPAGNKQERRWGIRSRAFSPELPVFGQSYRYGGEDDWHELCADERIKLPEYVPDVAAGAPAPLQLSPWKIKALKIALILEARGYVTTHDFKAIGIDMSRWRNGGWLKPSDRKGVWLRGAFMPEFKAQHPTVYEQIKADSAKWMPPETPLKATQMALGV